MPKAAKELLEIAGGTVALSNPDKLYFPAAGITKRELARYYLAVAPGVLRALARRPMILKRYVHGATGEPFYQKRAPANHPAFIDIATFRFPSGRSADEVVVNNEAALVWVVNLGCIELHPHAVRAEDMDRPDELRIDLDPVPGVGWAQILEVARVARDVLADFGLVGWPKTSGSRGAHLWVRIEPRWPFADVRRAALAIAREVEARAPGIATSKWWKEERRGVFLDYNQNARDRTTCCAYSVRATADARVSMPLSWDEFLACDPAAYTLRTVPALFAARGDAHEAIDGAPGRIDGLLALAARHEAEGLPDAPWPRPGRAAARQGTEVLVPDAERSEAYPGPPHFGKQEGEAPRVAPSRRRATKYPVITIAQAKHKADALAGLDRWKQRHPEVAARLASEDVLVDTNRGRATAWYRVRINLKNVPPELHPPPEEPDPDYDPRTEYEP